MFSDIAMLPLCKEFYKDGCMYAAVDGGLTLGDADTFSKVPDHLERFPPVSGESVGEWAERHGEPLYQAIREYKPINKAKHDAK